MSVNSMVDRFLPPEAPEATTPRARTLEETGSRRAERKSPAADAVGAALAAVVAYIPTEIVGTYVAILDLLGDAGRSWLWGVFLFFVVSTPIIVLVTFLVKHARRARAARTASWPWWAMGAATIAFAAWAAALPDSVVKSAASLPRGFGAAAVVVTALILGTLSPLFEPGAKKT